MKKASPYSQRQPFEAETRHLQRGPLSVLLTDLAFEADSVCHDFVPHAPHRVAIEDDADWRFIAVLKGDVEILDQEGEPEAFVPEGQRALFTSGEHTISSRVSGEVVPEIIDVTLRCVSADPVGVQTLLPEVIVAGSADAAWSELSRLLLRHAFDVGDGAYALITTALNALLIGLIHDWVIEHQQQLIGVLAAAADPVLGPTIQFIHEHPEHDHSVEQLASDSGLGRTVFIERFKRVTGMPPGAYTRALRLDHAARLLCESTIEVHEIAARVGYQSSGAFCTAFKNWSGFSPGIYREQKAESPVRNASRRAPLGHDAVCGD